MSRQPLPDDIDRQDDDAGLPLSGGPAFLVVGRFRSSHGLKGEISMDPERLRKGKQIYAGKEHRPLVINNVRSKDKLLLLTLEGYTDCDQVNTMRNLLVYVCTESLPSLPKDQYYFHQLVGLKVIDDTGALLGQLEEVLETGANDVYVVRSPSGQEVLLPAIDSVILKIDLERGEMTVRPQVWS
jgi:16S rRNA processing protein RimM